MKKILSLIALLFLVGVLHAEEAKIYYPSEAAAPITAVPAGAPAKSTPITTSVLYLALLAAMGYATYIMWKKKTVPQRSGATSKEPLQIINTRPLGNRQFLVVVKYKEKELLLGVGQGFISKLDTCDKDVATCEK